MDAFSQGHGPPSFWTQANALLRKNISYQKRNLRTNIRLLLFPFLVCILLVIIQAVVNHELRKAKYRCGCTCIDRNGDGSCETVCGIEYSTPDQVATCPITSPPPWSAFLQILSPQYRASGADFIPFTDLPDQSCKETQSCPATVLLTGTNQSFEENFAGRLFPTFSSLDFSDYSRSLANVVLGSDSLTRSLNFIEPAFSHDIYIVQPLCPPNFTISITIPTETKTFQQGDGNSRMEKAEEEIQLVKDEEHSPNQCAKSVKTKVPEIEVHLFRRGKGPIDVFKSTLGGWDRDQLEVLDILDKYGFKCLYAFNTQSGRGVPVHFNPKNGRSLLTYADGSVVYFDGEPKDSLIRPITKTIFSLTILVILIAIFVKETPEWFKKANFLGGVTFPPWVLACMVIVFTRMRKRTRDFLKKYGW